MNRKIRNLTLGALASTALITAGFAAPAFAASSSTATSRQQDQVVQASKSGVANPDLRLSQDGYNVMRDVRAARVSIFNGDIDTAKKFVKLAQDDLAKTQADDTRIKKSDKLGKDQANWVPIDGQLVVADNFVATPDKAKHIAAGNAKLKQGKTKEAMDELKLADVDVGFTRLLMPLNQTKNQVNLSYDLLNSGDYYQANMALKAAEDGLNVDTVMLTDDAGSGKTHPARSSQSSQAASTSKTGHSG